MLGYPHRVDELALLLWPTPWACMCDLLVVFIAADLSLFLWWHLAVLVLSDVFSVTSRAGSSSLSILMSASYLAAPCLEALCRTTFVPCSWNHHPLLTGHVPSFGSRFGESCSYLWSPILGRPCIASLYQCLAIKCGSDCSQSGVPVAHNDRELAV